MNSAGSSVIERTSSEESDIHVPNFRHHRDDDDIIRSYEIDESDEEDYDELQNSLESTRMTQIKNPFAFPTNNNSSSGGGVVRRPSNKRRAPQPPTKKASSSTPTSTPPPAMASLAASAAQSVNSSVDLLRRLQSVEEPTAPNALSLDSASNAAPASDLAAAALEQVRHTKARILCQVPERHRARVLPPEAPQPLREFPLLFGRCFNLSLNLKILSHAQCLDAVLAQRILSDLCVLEVSLQERIADGKARDKQSGGNKSAPEAIVGKMMSGLKLAVPAKAKIRPKLSLR